MFLHYAIRPHGETGVSPNPRIALTSFACSSIFLGMSNRHVVSDRAAFELALIGVAGHSVADVLCS
ncbi:Ms4533A family Cys-rich leader peptide [Streptomyces sp. Qhu_M48]|uniref:Ms4533A family Cys-rich leader peptide n=1 Tax=Streptomyces sp. Qhu_M48 TaxID=3435889 RepID=UPI003F5099CE